jgi:cell division protein FtsL
MKYLRNYSSINNRQLEHNDETPEFDSELKLLRPKMSINRWMVFGIIAFVAFLAVISVLNVVKVNELLMHTNNLEQEYLKVRHQNDVLKAQINRLEAPERITLLAKEKLGMIMIDEAPQFINQ